MPGLDADTRWSRVHEERRALAGLLAELSPPDWEAPSLCEGWRIRDVAGHVISSPQMRASEIPGMLWRGRGSFNRMILVDGQRRGRQPIEQILADFERFDGSRSHPITTTGVEPLVDILVHTQDIARALGIAHEMPVDAARVAADRSRLLALTLGSSRVVRSVRMIATDTDWSRGRGPELRGPMQELLMVCAGRGRAARDLTGDGVEAVRA